MIGLRQEATCKPATHTMRALAYAAPLRFKAERKTRSGAVLTQWRQQTPQSPCAHTSLAQRLHRAQSSEQLVQAMHLK